MHSTRDHATRPVRSLKMVLAASLLAAACISAPAYAQLPPPQMYGSTEYVSGGFGLEESTAFKQAMSQYPLALTFASQVDGKAAYTGDVQVVIRDDNDVTVLNVTSTGPFLLAKLASGKYQVFATYESQTQSRSVTIEANGSTRLTFQWDRPATGAD